MKVIGVILCIISLFLLYKRWTLIIFGQSTQATIIGLANGVKGTRGAKVYPYKVRYLYNGEEYIAQSIESYSNIGLRDANDYIGKPVTVSFKEKNPDVVTIKDFHEMTRIGAFLFLLGLLCVLI